MNIGDKVICVEAGRNADFPQYKSPLRLNGVYVIQNIVTTPSGKTGLQLIGVSLPPEWGHQSFSPRRFRLLSAMKMEARIAVASKSLRRDKQGCR